MALHIHRAERTDLLADRLGALLSEPPDDPLAEELVLVPAHGVERWLSQRLSHVLGRAHGGDGVCAAVAFRSPGSLIAEITGTADGDTWSPEAMTWPLLEAIDASLDQPWCRTLATHLGHFHRADDAELRRGRRYAVARRLAGLFACYARQRPQLLVDWLDARATDGAGGDLDGDLHWQPPLWRALVAAVGTDPPHVRHAKTVARLREAPSENLPPRLSLFGHTRLACTDIELLDALAIHHDLHLWLPHPSDQLWQALTAIHGAVPRSDDDSRDSRDSRDTAHHPLLQTLGRDLRELQRALPGDPQTDEYLCGAGISEDPDTLLGWLQSDIAANEVRPEGRVHDGADRSVQVHACHGPARQVDVLREVLLGLLEDDPTLEPRDILVMCPDIETYAPLIVAGFGLGELAGETHPAHRLRVMLADRALTQTNPLLGVAAELLDIAESRATASQVLNLAQTAPVRNRFSFTDDDLEAITTWVQESNIRWGFDAAHRAPYGLNGIVHNTWRFGLDRILTGVAMSEDSRAWLHTALPLDDVASNRVELAGRLAEFVTRLQAATDEPGGTRALAQWIAALAGGVASLTRVHPDDAWQQGQLGRKLSEILEQAGSRADTQLRLADVRALLSGHLAGRPTRANFRTGTLTVCTMVPMRSVPHRVICLVGLDDRVFPRQDHVDGDDVLARRPLTGERDIRSEDRQLLLDAVCAATETLVITYTGADEHTGKSHPPAVPLAELLDALDATAEEPVRGDILIRHPLQPFDRRNVTPGELVPDVPFTFDPTALAAAKAAVGARSTAIQFAAAPLPVLPQDDISLAGLLDFFGDPVKGFFTALGYTLPWDIDGIDDAMPVALGPLQEWQVGDRMLRDILRGMEHEGAQEAEWRRGALPPLKLGWRQAGTIAAMAADLADSAIKHQQGDPSARDVDIGLGDARRIAGTVKRVFDNRIVTVTYSKLSPKCKLNAWISLIALAANGPDREWSAYCVGRDNNGQADVCRLTVPPHPLAVLRDLVLIFDAGRREPLPLPLKTSYAWAQKRSQGRRNPAPLAASTWRKQNNRGRSIGENTKHAHVRVWGPDAPFEVLLSDPPRPGEEMPDEDTRFGALAVRLWAPLLGAEGKPC